MADSTASDGRLVQRCPHCESRQIVPARGANKANLLCWDCRLCWHHKSDELTLVDPEICSGCEHSPCGCLGAWGEFLFGESRTLLAMKERGNHLVLLRHRLEQLVFSRCMVGSLSHPDEALYRQLCGQEAALLQLQQS